MTTTVDPFVTSAERLCLTLERLGDALVDLDTSTLLETEDTLNRLTAVLASAEAPEDMSRLEPLIRRTREALRRCERLGASYRHVANVRLQLCMGTSYGPTGARLDGDATLREVA